MASSASQNVFCVGWFLSATSVNEEGDPIEPVKNVSPAVVSSGAAFAELTNSELTTTARTLARIPMETLPFCFFVSVGPFQVRPDQCIVEDWELRVRGYCERATSSREDARE